MSDNDRNDPRGAGGRDKPKKKAGAAIPRKPKPTGDLSRALRSVYDKTLRESVPRDFLDLLGKLD